MATLISALFGCDTVDRKATEPLITQLSTKYGKNFTIYALGDRINKETVTAYLFADDNPTMLFTAKITSNEELVFENYAYRSICRRVETIINTSFEEYGIETECFVDFSIANNYINFDTSVETYIRQNTPKNVTATIIASTKSDILGEDLEKIYKELFTKFFEINIGTSLFLLSSADFNNIEKDIQLETQVFNLYRLRTFGINDEIKELNIRMTKEGLSMSASEIDNLIKGVK